MLTKTINISKELQELDGFPWYARFANFRSRDFGTSVMSLLSANEKTIYEEINLCKNPQMAELRYLDDYTFNLIENDYKATLDTMTGKKSKE